jgi:hypothetical protein
MYFKHELALPGHLGKLLYQKSHQIKALGHKVQGNPTSPATNNVQQ